MPCVSWYTQLSLTSPSYVHIYKLLPTIKQGIAMDGKQCPQCLEPLVRRTAVRQQSHTALSWECSTCTGRMIGVSVIKHSLSREQFRWLWQSVQACELNGHGCGICQQPMRTLLDDSSSMQFDVCKSCYMVWVPSQTLHSLHYPTDSQNSYNNIPSPKDLRSARSFYHSAGSSSFNEAAFCVAEVVFGLLF